LPPTSPARRSTTTNAIGDQGSPIGDRARTSHPPIPPRLRAAARYKVFAGRNPQEVTAHDPLCRLGRLAVDVQYQGKRLGELLLMDAVRRVRSIQEHAGVVGLFVDAIGEQAARFYAHFGFEAFADGPLKLFFSLFKKK